MTNLEFIRSLNANDFVNFVFNKSNYMCLQHGCYSNEIWQVHCLGLYGGYKELGCSRCRADWLNSEVGSIETQLIDMAKKRRGELDSEVI